MIEAEDSRLREAISGGAEMPDVLRGRFDEQMKAVMSRRLTTGGRIARLAGATLMTVAALLFALQVEFGRLLIICRTNGSSRDWGVVFFVAAFCAATLVFAAGALHCMYELRTNLVASRRLQKLSFAIRYGCLFAIGILLPVLVVSFTRRDGDYVRYMLAAFSLTLFYWSLVVFLALYRVARWNREDVLLELKRTRLEIALLAESMSKKPE